MLFMCTLLVFIATPKYLILVQLLISNSKRELQNKQRLVKGEVMMCVGIGSKIDSSHTPFTFGISVETK